MLTVVVVVEEPPQADRRTARARVAPVLRIVFAFDFIAVSLSSSVLVFRGSLFHQIEAFDMAGRESLEIGLDQSWISERVDGEAESVAVEANRTNHFFVGFEVPVLVVLYMDFAIALLNSGQMAGSAGDTGVSCVLIFRLFLPEVVVGRAEVVF